MNYQDKIKALRQHHEELLSMKNELMEWRNGIYDKYKVGKNDRGLVIVVGYLDHSYFIAPGTNLEKELSNSDIHHISGRCCIYRCLPGTRSSAYSLPWRR